MVFLLLLAEAAQAQVAPAQARLPRPTAAVAADTCSNAGCHTEVKDYKAVHGPVNVNACDACHTLADAAKHTYTLARPKTELCTFCHKIDTANQPVVHQPVKTGDCLPCHNPHGGKTAKLIRGNSMKETCNQCHKDVVGTQKNVHGPVAAGACEACHSPHAAKHPKLLVEQGKALCTTCHKEMSDQLKRAKVTHKPVMEGDCSSCHDPHASNFKMQVKSEPVALCTGCHDKVKSAAMDSKFKHSIVTADQGCMNCHTAHGGPLASLMKAQPVDVCIKCHNTDQKTPDGRVVKGVPEVTNAKLIKHGPVKDGNCSGCHNVHGSDVTRLLSKNYPESFYAKFDPENFALCFSCHDPKLVQTKEAQGLTGFRNGTQNLHFVHVDKEKGRTCRACHETHASANPVHLRNSVPYGQWELPVNFKKTDTGGSCLPGCHKEFGYDRTTPINYSTDATAPPRTAAPATPQPAPAQTRPATPEQAAPIPPARPAETPRLNLPK
jgi:predicted CXXCH cytochrome family protein